MPEEDKKVTEYIGESSKSLYTRSKAHMDAYRLLEHNSVFWRHHLMAHQEYQLGTVDIRFSAISYFTSCFRRQIAGAVHIKESVRDPKRII